MSTGSSGNSSRGPPSTSNTVMRATLPSSMQDRPNSVEAGQTTRSAQVRPRPGADRSARRTPLSGRRTTGARSVSS